MCKVDEQCSELMDALAAEAATGVYSTKKERNMDTAWVCEGGGCEGVRVEGVGV